MGATNHTTNYELSQFIGTDKPSWLNDYNNDMLKIDTAVKNNATATSNAQTTANTADGKADGNATAIQTLNTQINTPDTGLAATVAGHTTAITGINSTIGTTPLTTVAQTLTGAIEEVKGSIPSISGTMVFNGEKNISVTSDGVKTVSTLLNELFAEFLTYISQKGTNYRFQCLNITLTGYIKCYATNYKYEDKTFAGAMTFGINYLSSSSIFMGYIQCSASGSAFYFSTDSTIADRSSDVPQAGNDFIVTINEYTLNA